MFLERSRATPAPGRLAELRKPMNAKNAPPPAEAGDGANV